MEAPKKNLEEKYIKRIVCPNDSCLNVPKIEYTPELFNLSIQCDNKECNYCKKILDINNYLNLPEKKLYCGQCSTNILNHDLFSYCKKCNKFYDISCTSDHISQNQNHDIAITNKEGINNCCLSHLEKYECFCNNCNTSLCIQCLSINNTHEEHNLIFLKDKCPNDQKLNEIKKIIEEQENSLKKVKKIINKCITKFENDIKIKKIIIENYLDHKRNYNSIYNLNALSENLKVDNKYKHKIEKIFENLNSNKNIDYFMSSNMALLYYYMMLQNDETKYKILNIIKNEFNYNNNDNDNNIKQNLDDNNANIINNELKTNKVKLNHFKDKSETIKNIIEKKIITSIARLKNDNLVVGFKSGIIKIYDSEKLCSHNKGKEELLLIDKFNHRKISYIYEIKENILLCSTFSKIYKIKLTNNSTSYEYLSKIKLPSYEFCKRIIQLGRELILCLTQKNKNKKLDNNTYTNTKECYLRIFKIDLDSQERNKEEEIGYLSDYENDACYTGGKEEEGEGEGCESEFCDSGGEIDNEIKLYKKNITNNTKYLCSIFPTKTKKYDDEDNEYLYEFIATSNDNNENSNGENKIYFYGIIKNFEGHHQLIFNKIGEMSQISCSSMVDSICNLGNNKIGIAIQKFNNENHGLAIIDYKKKELLKIIGKESINLLNISFDKNLFFCSVNFKEEGNKYDSNMINYIKIERRNGDGKATLSIHNSKNLLSNKCQFSHIIQLKPTNNQNQNKNEENLFYGLFSGCNIFIIKIKIKRKNNY